MDSSTVTIDKAYFETILRRAQFHTPGIDYTTPPHLPTVTIPKLNHDRLLKTAREYDNLRRNLYNGGVTEETLAILINDDGQDQDRLDGMASFIGVDDSSESAAFLSQKPRSSALATPTIKSTLLDYTYGRNNNYSTNSRGQGAISRHNHLQKADDFFIGPNNGDVFHDNDYGLSENRRGGFQFQKNAKRSVLLSNLGESVTHADVIDAVRGGMLLDIYLRSNERTVSVSFLDENHAKEFFHHSKRNDLYIRGKRVDIGWAERQFTLPNHVANKIAIGATRNLVIQNITPRHTEGAIRDDLEHIHNLVVIRISFKNRNCRIETNSIHNAMFARTCMMSRAAYRGCKISWDVDDCAGPLSKVTPAVHKENLQPKKSPPINRFNLLNMDGADDDSEGDHRASRATVQTTVSSADGGITL